MLIKFNFLKHYNLADNEKKSYSSIPVNVPPDLASPNENRELITVWDVKKFQQ